MRRSFASSLDSAASSTVSNSLPKYANSSGLINGSPAAAPPCAAPESSTPAVDGPMAMP